jgi:hypothetical protein
MRLHNHLSVWPLWPLRLHWSRQPQAWAPAGSIHWIQQRRTDEQRRCYLTTVVHFGRLKLIVGGQP